MGYHGLSPRKGEADVSGLPRTVHWSTGITWHLFDAGMCMISYACTFQVRNAVSSSSKLEWFEMSFHPLWLYAPLPLPWASGLPVAIQCAWNLDPSVHWNATGEMPVCFQWSSSGFAVVFQCVLIMQINTGSPLEHHWVLAPASVVPVASQCTCGSSGLPVCSNYAN